ncbi:MAG TPA: hypothetical protein VM219_08200, partial [Phycisphaerae bacterium]|nr:hypothetical protein [Phycisphaerae bacterium]
MRRAALLLALFALVSAAGCRTVSRAPSAEDDLGGLDFREVVQSAKDKVFPAVVYIKAIRETHE